jgi:hypothetical protein
MSVQRSHLTGPTRFGVLSGFASRHRRPTCHHCRSRTRVQHIKIRTASVFETWSGSELKAEVVVAVVTVIAVVPATRFLTFEVVNDLRIAIKDRMCA